MSQYSKHVFVCTGGPYCSYDGDAGELFMRMKRLIAAAGRGDDIRVNKAGCLNQCGHGPMVVVYPEGVWYAGAQAEDAAIIVDEHLLGDRPVERLRFKMPPGTHKDTTSYPAEVIEFKETSEKLDEQRTAARQAMIARTQPVSD
jgi:(2Fe-2S) ferredoxin